MQVLVIANEELKAELFQGSGTDTLQIEWISDALSFIPAHPYHACIDLLFENSRERIEWLKNSLFELVIVSAVVDTLAQMPETFVRFNGWHTFLGRDIVEASAMDQNTKMKTAAVFDALNKKVEWVPDVAGFITARVVSSIINEAWFALEEQVSTPGEIDTAMKLGTNYPFGPFEWSERIGLANVLSLLQVLSAKQARYTPSSLLVKKAST